MEDSDSDARARYSELLKSLQIDGFVDEFQISGKKVTVSDYDDETLHNSEGGEVDLADRSRPLFWRASILLIVCASIAYLARCKFRRPRKNNKQNNRGKIKRKRKSKSLGRKSELLSPRSLKETRGDKIKNETTKDLLVVPLARNLAAPELVVERIDPRVASKALVQDLVGKMSVEHAQLPITGDALEADLVKTAQSFRKIIEKSGMGGSEEMVSTLSWQAAMTLKQTAAICQATSMAETRRYIFQTQQSHLDREISARQHGDLLATIREDKRCPRRLAGARAECFAALKVASLRSFALILGFKPFSLAMGLLLRCKLHSFTDLVMEMRDLLTSCPRSGSVFSGTTGYRLQPSYLLLSYVDSYVNGASCVAANAASMSYVLLYCSAASFVSRAFGLPSFSTTLVVCLLAFSETFLSTEILALLATVLIASLATATYIMIQIWTSRRMFTTSKELQSNQLVSESLIHFSRMTDAIQLTPFLLAICLSAGHTIFSYV